MKTKVINALIILIMLMLVSCNDSATEQKESSVDFAKIDSEAIIPVVKESFSLEEFFSPGIWKIVYREGDYEEYVGGSIGKGLQLAEKYNLSMGSTFEIYDVRFDSKVVWTFHDFGGYTNNTLEGAESDKEMLLKELEENPGKYERIILDKETFDVIYVYPEQQEEYTYAEFLDVVSSYLFNEYCMDEGCVVTINEDKTVIRLNCKSHYDPDRGAGRTGGIAYYIKVK
jgi:hypothetical protein